jgi:hypothetical protein
VPLLMGPDLSRAEVRQQRRQPPLQRRPSTAPRSQAGLALTQESCVLMWRPAISCRLLSVAGISAAVLLPAWHAPMAALIAAFSRTPAWARPLLRPPAGMKHAQGSPALLQLLLEALPRLASLAPHLRLALGGGQRVAQAQPVNSLEEAFGTQHTIPVLIRGGWLTLDCSEQLARGLLRRCKLLCKGALCCGQLLARLSGASRGGIIDCIQQQPCCHRGCYCSLCGTCAGVPCRPGCCAFDIWRAAELSGSGAAKQVPNRPVGRPQPCNQLALCVCSLLLQALLRDEPGSSRLLLLAGACAPLDERLRRVGLQDAAVGVSSGVASV